MRPLSTTFRHPATGVRERAGYGRTGGRCPAKSVASGGRRGKMSKPEFWWCMKRGKTLLAHTARRQKKDAVSIYFEGMGLTDAILSPKAGVVRIRVEEVPEKEG